MTKINSILLVDDDKASNFINELLIRKAEITRELHVARNGSEAINLIKDKCLGPDGDASRMPQLILLDLNMPVMDGFGFLDAFQELEFATKAKTLIAVLTTSLNPRDEARVKAAGIDLFLNKPLKKEVLQQLVGEHFGDGQG